MRRSRIRRISKDRRAHLVLRDEIFTKNAWPQSLQSATELRTSGVLTLVYPQSNQNMGCVDHRPNESGVHDHLGRLTLAIEKQ